MTVLAAGLHDARDTQILRLLQRVIDIGAYRKAWTAQDVDRVVARHIGRPAPQPPPAPAPVAPVSVPVPLPPPTREQQPLIVELTPAQTAVLDALCQAMTNGAAGRHLGISEDTVKSHVRAILAALGARDRLHAVVMVLTGVVAVVTKPREKAAS